MLSGFVSAAASAACRSLCLRARLAARIAAEPACFRGLNSGLDGVLVSDVGKPIEVLSNRRAGGLIRTALRASDILMDRVWQQEIERFQDAEGFVFAPITEVVEHAEDPTALHPEIQQQVAGIRNDLDRFSPLEISSLVRHGYCVGRKACRAPRAVRRRIAGQRPLGPASRSARRGRRSPGGHGAGGAGQGAGDGHDRRAGVASLGRAAHLEHLEGPPGLGCLRLCADYRADPFPGTLSGGQYLPAHRFA
jgi:hypothetical protein